MTGRGATALRYAPLADALVAAVERDSSREVCGFVVEDPHGGLSVLPMRNVSGTGEDEEPDEAREGFLVDPEAHLRLELRLRREGGRIAAVFHSHVDGVASPSRADTEALTVDGGPLLPGTDLLVAGMRSGKAAEIRAFTWDGARFTPAGRLFPSVAPETSRTPGAKSHPA